MTATFFGSTEKESPSIQAPHFEIPLGDLNLALTKTLGKNKWIRVDNFTVAASYHSFNFDDQNQLHYANMDGIDVYDTQGTGLSHIPFSPTILYCIQGLAQVGRSSNGDYFLLSMSNPTCDGQIYKISADGFIQQAIISSTSPHPLPPAASNDVLIVKKSDHSEEIHIPANYLSGGTSGTNLNNEMLVYDLNGTYLKSYGLAQNHVYSFLAQSPVTKDIYAGSYQDDLHIFHFDENGNYIDTLTFPSVTRIGGLNFDSTGRLYITDLGDFVSTGGGPTVGVHVFSSPNGSVVRQVLTSVAHPIHYSNNVEVSSDGTLLDLYNNYTRVRERYIFNGTSYVYSENLSSQSSAPGEFNLSTNSAAGVLLTDELENIYINDGGNRRIQVFSADGTSLLQNFSIAHPDITPAFGTAATLTSQGQIMNIGWKQNAFDDYTLTLQGFSKTGTPSASVSLHWPYRMHAVFIGIDNKDVLWFKAGDYDPVTFANSSYLVGVSLSGVVTRTIDFTDPLPVFGVSGAGYFKVIGSYLYFLDTSTYSTLRYDFNGNTVTLMTMSDYSSGGVYLLIPENMQMLSNGKFLTTALTLTAMMTAEYKLVIIDPETFKITTRISLPSDLTPSQIVWTSHGIYGSGSFDRIFHFNFY